jgi:hypothetical protein
MPLIQDIVINGRYAYVPGGTTGLRIFDITNPTSPKQVGFIDTDDSISKIVINGSSAYAEIGSKVHIIDVSNPANPNEIGFFDPSFCLSDLAIKDDHAYITTHGGPWCYSDRENSLLIYDISDPANSIQLGFYETGLSGWEGTSIAAVKDGYAYISNYSHFYIVDISNPNNPSETARLQSYEGMITVYDNYIYHIGFEGLKIFDISNPCNPYEIGFLETGRVKTRSLFLKVEGSYAYITDDEKGLVIVDISNTTTPVKVGSSSYVTEVDLIEGNLLYTIDNGGLYIIRNDLITSTNRDPVLAPSEFALFQNYPNPFNPTTTIQYEVPQQSQIRISIYDVLGRKVKTLINRTSQPGTFELTWDGTDEFQNPVAGGVYFCGLEAESFVKVIKLALVK